MDTATPQVDEVVPLRLVVTYLVVAFAWSWTWWFAALAVGGPATTHVPGLLGPAVAALVADRLVRPDRRVPELWRRLRRVRVPGRWVLVSLAPLVVGAIGVAIVAALGQAPSLSGFGRFAGLPATHPLLLALLVLALNGYGEEVGWRGLLWPALRRRWSMAVTAWLVAGVWALWHAPTFLLDTGLGDLTLVAVPGWLLGLAAGSLVLGWLTERSDSLLPPVLFHTALNLASATDATAGLPATLTVGGVIVGAMVIGRRDPLVAAAPRG